MSTVKTAFSLDSELMNQIGAAAREMNISRSRFISDAAKEMLRKRETTKLADAIDEAYAGGLDEEEQAWLDASARSFAEVADEWEE
jgi:metal-responsive CopG/Arc/MetJ family transcriptional regulator